MKQNALPFLAGYLVYAALERADRFLPDALSLLAATAAIVLVLDEFREGEHDHI